MSEFRLGDLIVLSKPYAYVLSNVLRGKRCDYCLRKNNCMKRCSQCLYLYFCDKKCQREAWEFHKEECKYILEAKPKEPSAFMRLITLILFKIKKFGMDEPFEEVYGRKVSFRTLMSHVPEMKQNAKACQEMIALLATLKDFIGVHNIPPIDEFIEIFGKICINTFSICDNEMRSIGSGLYLGASVFDHSCQPNAEVVFDSINLSVRAVCDIPHRDISKVFISYIDELMLSTSRKQQLREQYYFECKCSYCSSTFHDELMTKLITVENGTERTLLKLKNELQHIKQMKKDNVNPEAIYEECWEVLEALSKIVGDTHLDRIIALELAFDACIDMKNWTEAIAFGKELIQPYKLLRGPYHPTLGIHFFMVGKIQNFLNDAKSSERFLMEAEKILRVTHGKDHLLYKDLMDVLRNCQMHILAETK